jgi:hypothetical protein
MDLTSKPAKAGESTFDLFQQLYPRCIGLDEKGEDIYEARIIPVGQIQAHNTTQALTLARKLPVFLKGQQLGKFPIIKEKKK